MHSASTTQRGPAANATRQRWHALHDHFEGSAEVYVARVFCDENDPNDDDDTCGALLGGRRAVYPIVLYGDCYEPEAYWGPRTLDALKALGEGIRAPCSAWRPDRCDGASKAKLDGFVNMPARGLAELARTEAVARRARVEALEAALEEKRESLLEEWEARDALSDALERRLDISTRLFFSFPPGDTNTRYEYELHGLAPDFVASASLVALIAITSLAIACVAFFARASRRLRRRVSAERFASSFFFFARCVALLGEAIASLRRQM